MRLTWHEAVVKEDRLIIRWPTEEKRLRTLIFIPLFAVTAGIVLALLSGIVGPGVGPTATPIGILIAGVLFLLGFASIWFSKLWVWDKQRNMVLRGGRQPVANLDEFHRFVIKREKREGHVVFVLLAEREKESEPLELGVMDQDDAQELGKELARFTHRPLTYR